MTDKKTLLRVKRHKIIRKKIHGTQERPRLAVFRSNKNIFVQVINDDKKTTLVSSSSLQLKIPNGSNIAASIKVGSDIGKKCKTKKIKTIVFDRGGFLYHGRIKALADAVRKEGIVF